VVHWRKPGEFLEDEFGPFDAVDNAAKHIHELGTLHFSVREAEERL
jgi:hypothetical protein